MFELSINMFINFFTRRKLNQEPKELSALFHTMSLARRAGLNDALWTAERSPRIERLAARPCIEKLKEDPV